MQELNSDRYHIDSIFRSNNCSQSMTYYFWLGEDAEDWHELEKVWDMEERWEGDFVRPW